MAKTITIRDNGFMDATPLRMRPRLVSFVYSMAASHGWAIRVAGQHWDSGHEATPRARTHSDHEMTDARWASLMGESLR